MILTGKIKFRYKERSRAGQVSIFLTVVLIFISLGGCILPLPQWELISRSSDITGQVNEDGYFEVWVDQSYWPNKYDLISNLSWAEDPNGTRLNIEYETGEKPSYNGTWYYKIFPLETNGNRLSSLRNGAWKITIHLQKNETVKIKELEFKLWTFFYSPLIHGAPN